MKRVGLSCSPLSLCNVSSSIPLLPSPPPASSLSPHHTPLTQIPQGEKNRQDASHPHPGPRPARPHSRPRRPKTPHPTSRRLDQLPPRLHPDHRPRRPLGPEIPRRSLYRENSRQESDPPDHVQLRKRPNPGPILPKIPSRMDGLRDGREQDMRRTLRAARAGMERDSLPTSPGRDIPIPRLHRLRPRGRALLDLDGEAADHLAHFAARGGRGAIDASEHGLRQLLQRDAFDSRGHGGAAQREEVRGGRAE